MLSSAPSSATTRSEMVYSPQQNAFPVPMPLEPSLHTTPQLHNLGEACERVITSHELPLTEAPEIQARTHLPLEGGKRDLFRHALISRSRDTCNEEEDAYSLTTLADSSGKNSRKTSHRLSGHEELLTGPAERRQDGNTLHENFHLQHDVKHSTISVPLEMEKEIPGLRAVTTRLEYERYRKGFTYPLVTRNPYRISPCTTSFNPTPLPEGWKAFIHPEGTRYFYCDSPDNPLPVVTEAWISDQRIYEKLRDYMVQIFTFMEKHHVAIHTQSTQSERGHNSYKTFGPPREPVHHLPPVVLVLELRLSGCVGYYFVSHATQTLFWLDTFDFTHLISEVCVQHSDWLVGLQMKYHYWYHNELFPHLYEMTEVDIQELDDMLVYGIGDVMTATNSTVTTELDTLKYAHKTLTRFRHKGWLERSVSLGERWVFYRTFSQFYRERFLNLYGDRGARLNSTQSLHYSPYRRRHHPIEFSSRDTKSRSWYAWTISSLPRYFFGKRNNEINDDMQESEYADPPSDPSAKAKFSSSIFMKFSSIIMFGGPGLHIRRLRELTVDSVVSLRGVNRFTEKMVEEWRDIALYSTVVLTANVSFLAIQSIDAASEAGKMKTNSQRASYLSVLASMGTIIFSLALLRQHREAMNIAFVASRSASRWELESLALIYAMPYALLIWSMLSFFAAFAFLWYASKDVIVMALVSFSCLSFAAVLTWAISAAYQTSVFGYGSTLLWSATRAAIIIWGWMKAAIVHTRNRISKAARTVTRWVSGKVNQPMIGAMESNGNPVGNFRTTATVIFQGAGSGDEKEGVAEV